MHHLVQMTCDGSRAIHGQCVRQSRGRNDDKVVDRFPRPINLQKWSLGKAMDAARALDLAAICFDGRTCFSRRARIIVVRTR